MDNIIHHTNNILKNGQLDIIEHMELAQELLELRNERDSECDLYWHDYAEMHPDYLPGLSEALFGEQDQFITSEGDILFLEDGVWSVDPLAAGLVCKSTDGQDVYHTKADGFYDLITETLGNPHEDLQWTCRRLNQLQSCAHVLYQMCRHSLGTALNEAMLRILNQMREHSEPGLEPRQLELFSGGKVWGWDETHILRAAFPPDIGLHFVLVERDAGEE